MGILLMHEFEESGRKRQGENVRWMLFSVMDN
jgi:phage terminase large subunit-like protein